jgi:hypothetical protein
MDTLNPNWFLRARLKTRQLLLLIALDEHRNIARPSTEVKVRKKRSKSVYRLTRCRMS